MLIAAGTGERLKEERARLDLNQTDFGLLGGVSRGTQKAYELESSSPDLRYLMQLEQAGVDVLYVLTGQRQAHAEQGLDPIETRILDNYRVLPESDKAAVQRLTSALAESAGRYSIDRKRD